jgi:hypothetical protein
MKYAEKSSKGGLTLMAGYRLNRTRNYQAAEPSFREMLCHEELPRDTVRDRFNSF